MANSDPDRRAKKCDSRRQPPSRVRYAFQKMVESFISSLKQFVKYSVKQLIEDLPGRRPLHADKKNYRCVDKRREILILSTAMTHKFNNRHERYWNPAQTKTL